MRVEKYKGKHWAVYDGNGSLICVTVYKRGALNVAQIIQTLIKQKEVTCSV